MQAFNEIKKTVDAKMNFINKILVMSVNGEDPDMVEEDWHSGSVPASQRLSLIFHFLFNEKQDGLQIAKDGLRRLVCRSGPASPVFPFSVAQKVRTSSGIHPGFCIFKRDKAPEIGGFIVKTSVRAGRRPGVSRFLRTFSDIRINSRRAFLTGSEGQDK